MLDFGSRDRLRLHRVKQHAMEATEMWVRVGFGLVRATSCTTEVPVVAHYLQTPKNAILNLFS